VPVPEFSDDCALAKSDMNSGEPPYFAIGNRCREFAMLDADRHAGGGTASATKPKRRIGTGRQSRNVAKLMASWTEFCRSPPVTKIGKVVPIRGGTNEPQKYIPP
jgi:hypothetical protein